MTELLLLVAIILLLILIGVLKVRIERKDGKIVMVGLFFNDQNYVKIDLPTKKVEAVGKPEI